MKAASLTSALLVSRSVARAAAAPGSRAGMGGNVQLLFTPKPPAALAGVETDERLTRVSLRMQAKRAGRLKAAAQNLGRSNQALMVAAIDHYIEHVLPEMLAERTDYGEGHTATSSLTVLDFGRAQTDVTP
jgi:predicted DNA-binding protein